MENIKNQYREKAGASLLSEADSDNLNVLIEAVNKANNFGIFNSIEIKALKDSLAYTEQKFNQLASYEQAEQKED